jgi:hypothetical protein
MPRLSLPLAVYKKPLQGMDARESRPEGAPALLFNVDTSWEGTWRARPGFFRKTITTAANKCMGIYPFRRGGDFFIVSIWADLTAKRMVLRFHVDEADASGNQLSLVGTTLLDGADTNFPGLGEPYTDKHFYDFVQAGRFLYFCNGFGRFFEVELKTPNPPLLYPDGLDIRNEFLEDGMAPSVLSYLQNGFSPASLHFFFDQLVVTGFEGETLIDLSNPLDASQTDIPDDILNAARDKVIVSQSHVFVSEPGLWRSYPLEDAGGMYWLFDEDVVASENVRQTLLVFTTKSVFRITGHGSATPRREWIADASLVSARAMCRFATYLFFVADEGCFVTDGGMVRKVSEPMDPLWFNDESPPLCRKTQQAFVKTVVPGNVNPRLLRECVAVDDRTRKQVYVSLPSAGMGENSMLWVWNYEDMISEQGPGKWSIWAGPEEEFTTSAVVVSTEAITAVTTHAVTTRVVCGAANFTGDYQLVAGDEFQVEITDATITASGIVVTPLNGTFTATLISATAFTVGDAASPVDTHSYASGTYTGTVHMPLGLNTNSTAAGSPKKHMHITAMAVDRGPGTEIVYTGTSTGGIYAIESSQVDSDGVQGTDPFKGTPTLDGFPVLMGLGLTGEVEADGRTIYTDVSVRMKQTMRNSAQDDNSPVMTVVARPEGEAQKLLKATDPELEFEQAIDIMQEGVSETTTSVIGDAAEPGIFLGSGAGGTSSPLMEKEYHRFYARLNVPDEEGRGVVVDIHRSAKDRSHDMTVEEVILYGLPKSGSQREQS